MNKKKKTCAQIVRSNVCQTKTSY